MMKFAKTYKDLIVYKKARTIAYDIFVLTKHFPNEEKYSLTDQIRRSSRSVGGQIAEAWAKRRYPKHFVSKLTDSDGEKFETQHWIDTAGDCGYISSKEIIFLTERLDEIGRILGTMISKADSFCGFEYSIKEELAEYFTEH